MLSVLDDPESDAANKSGVDGTDVAVAMVMESEPLVATLPAVSVCVAVMVCTPAESVETVTV